MKIEKEIENKQSLLSWILTLPPLQGFSSRETDIHFCQFLFNFLKYSFSNFLLFYLYNIFTVYFPSKSPLLKSFSFATSNFSYHLTSVFNIPSNSAITFFVFSKSSFSQLLCFIINLFHHTKYFITSFIFLLFKIFSTSHSSTLSTSTSFTSSTFCPSTCFLYYTI